MLDKLNKIWLKRLNPYISKDKILNWLKVSKRNQFQISLKLEGLKKYLTLIIIFKG